MQPTSNCSLKRLMLHHPDEFKDFRVGRLSQADAISIAIEYLASRHPAASFAFLFGSYAKGGATDISDIDICVVSDPQKGTVKYNGLFQGNLIQVILINQLVLAKNLIMPNNPDHFYTDIVNDGIFLHGDINQFNSYKQVARNLGNTPTTLTTEESLRIRCKVSDYLLTLNKLDDPLAILSYVGKISALVIEITLRSNGLGFGPGRYSFVDLMDNFPSLREELLSSIKILMVDRHFDEFNDVVIRAIQPHGGLAWKF